MSWAAVLILGYLLVGAVFATATVELWDRAYYVAWAPPVAHERGLARFIGGATVVFFVVTLWPLYAIVRRGRRRRPSSIGKD